MHNPECTCNPRPLTGEDAEVYLHATDCPVVQR